MKGFNLFLSFLVLASLPSCGKLKGEFAFMAPGDKGYKKVHQRIEFDARKGVNWLYRFENTGSRVELGVVISKKELLWVDIMTRGDYIDKNKKIVYGRLEGLEPGDYRIIITEVKDSGNVLVDQCPVYLYSDEESFD